MDLQRLEPFALGHHGLVHRSAAARLGVSTAAWYRGIESHLLVPISKNVARLPGAMITKEQQILAAVWSAGPDAFASHRPGVHLWGVPRPVEDPIDIMVPSRRRRVSLEGVVLHRPRDLLEIRPIIRAGIPTARPARLLCDLGAVDDQSVFDALSYLIMSKVISFRAARAGLARHAQRGHHGIAALRAAIDRWQLHDKVPDSVLELKMRELLHDHRLPPATFHARVHGYEVDFLVDGTPIIIECDGYGTHGLDADQFEFDRVRNAELLAHGHPIVHTTWKQVTRAPVAAAGRIRNVLAAWAPEVLAAHEAALALASGCVSFREPRRNGPGNKRAQKPNARPGVE